MREPPSFTDSVYSLQGLSSLRGGIYRLLVDSSYSPWPYTEQTYNPLTYDTLLNNWRLPLCSTMAFVLRTLLGGKRKPAGSWVTKASQSFQQLFHGLQTGTWESLGVPKVLPGDRRIRIFLRQPMSISSLAIIWSVWTQVYGLLSFLLHLHSQEPISKDKLLTHPEKPA